MSLTKVSIVRSDDVFAQVKQAVDLLGGIDKFVAKGQTVMLKVNVTGPIPPEKGSTTHPLFLDAVIRLFNEAGASRITVADGTGSATLGTVKVFEMTGYNYLLEKYDNVDFFDLNRDSIVTVPVSNPYLMEEIRVAHSMYGRWDVMVNLPMLKTHFLTGMSGAVKNMKGCIPPAEKRKMHDLGVNKCVADLSTVLDFDLTIMDGTIGSEGLGPKEGSPVGMKLVIAGRDPIAVDSVAASVMGFDVHDFEHICLAHAKRGGALELNDIDVLGNSIESVQRPFKPAIPTIPEEGAARIVNGHACSGCISAAVISVGRLADSGALQFLNDKGIYPTFAIGAKFDQNQEWDDPENTICLGNCAKGLADKGHGVFFPGCAPAGIHINAFLAERYGFDSVALESAIGK